MSLIFTLAARRGGLPQDADETPVLANALTAATAGIVRNDTGAAVVAAGVAMTRDGLGLYSYPLASVVAGVSYTAFRRVKLGGSTQVVPQTLVASPLAVLPLLLSLAEADALAGQLPQLARFKATADANVRVGLLALATQRVNAGRWQGGRTDPAQSLAFPRDGETSVPEAVKLATLYEAESIADGTRDRFAKLIDAGLTGQSTGSVSEQYNAAFAGRPAGTLCVEAASLMAPYRLTSGRLV